MARAGGLNSEEIRHIQYVEDITHLQLPQLKSLAKAWGVDLHGCNSKDEMLERVIKHWLQHNSNPPPEPPDLAGAFEEHQKTRTSLYDRYKKAGHLYESLTQKIKSNLEQSHQDVKRTFRDRKESLKSGECTIVIAGEVGAGKTSLLNLLLETQIFPSDSLKCTNTIVEIRCSDKKDAIFYYKPQLSDSGERERNIPPKIISLNSLNGIQEFKDCVAEYDQSDDNPYDRCEVFYPFKTLSKGVVIVDTPGIEGGSNVDKRLQTYLSRAFGFIYVINTNTAGGVQHSRLGHLLKTVVNDSEDFSPEASLFIGNKWEHVPEKDRVDVQRDIFYKLNQVYPGIRPNQIHYMSVKESSKILLKYKTKQGEHMILLNKVAQLVPSSLRQGMSSHYWWLSSFLARSSYLLRVTSVQHAMTREELERQFEGLRKHMEDLQKNTDETIGRLRLKVEFEIKKITEMIQNVLRDKTFVNRICNWEDTNECPKPERKWKSTVDVAAMKISERISRELDGWQRQNQLLYTIDKDIIGVFSKELGLMDDQIKELEEYLSSSRKGSMCKTMRVVPVKALFAKKKKKIERTYSTLGGAVSCVGMLDTDKKVVRRIFRKDYNNSNKAKKMTEATLLFLDSILGHKDFGVKLRKFFDRFFKDIDEAAKRIPGFLKADEQLIETLRHSIEEDDRLKEKLPELVGETADLLGKLDIFYINEIMKFDYELSEMEWKDKKVLGSGSFAQVYKTTIKKNDRPVAIKVSTDEVNQSNVTDILTEDRTMRDLRHENVVRYYGASYVKTSKGLQWIMVMELCKTTLKHIYTGSEKVDRNIPGSLDKDHPRYTEAARSMLDHAFQICLGLGYIHEKGYTHRDMKLENVLLAEDNVIKITDVGVAKVTQMLVRTANGSPAYMAPEVLLSSKIQTNKIDIYSFSLMFWEMWFGKDVADEINKSCLGYGFHGNAMDALKSNIAKSEGWRPPLSSSKRPPDAIIDLLKRGWAFDPEIRPSAKDFGRTLGNFLQNNL
ncbi:uncharacterized protein LOC123556064 [Mercenaria mercenaria]|uniref:uncharacterized protein LOC123556064 n=1 Tax=Mercenaria mercenaria TaxID=6596 RepID=UPI00234E6110|nr:uncharacterized protein LOC123556064 [Mercenaria mercenaria]XP_053403459.1 uncharacterized protein LOC123556064 [Mercenaria mercenaria]